MNFCSIFKLTRVDVGNVSKKGKNIVGCRGVIQLGGLFPVIPRSSH